MAIKRVFIANRGEIAVRINQAAKALGITTIQAYSEADKDMMAVRIADEAICVGPAIAKESYLDIRKMVAAAQAADAAWATAFAEEFGARAQQPGYEVYAAIAPALVSVDRSRVVSLLTLK